MTIYIRFLKAGMVKAEEPDYLLNLTQNEKLMWASGYLNSLSKQTLLDALSDFEEPAKNGIFDTAPLAEAIEDADMPEYIIVQTNAWHEWSNGSDVSEHSDIKEIIKIRGMEV